MLIAAAPGPRHSIPALRNLNSRAAAKSPYRRRSGWASSRDIATARPATAGSGIEPHGQAGARHVLLGRADRLLAEMEDRSREHCGRVAVADTLDQMFERSDAARGDHRHRHRVGDRAGEGDVEAPPGAVAIHRGEQDFAGAERDDLARVIDRVA